MRNLIDYLNYHTKLYDEGHPKISDAEWDDAYYKLVELEKETGIYFPDSPTQSISYQVVNELEKVKHNHPMLSLPKTKDRDEIVKFCKEGYDYITLCKMDGLTCSLRYLNGELVNAETRGDGEIGENILHNIKTITNIPQKISYLNELIIDGEIICKFDDFAEFSDEYKNPRNFASGSIRLLDSKECSKRKLSFIAWDVIKGFDDIDHLHLRLEEIQNLNFTVAPWGLNGIDFGIIEFLKDTAETMNYPIDGLVFKYNNIPYRMSLGRTDHHFNGALAYKFYDEEYETQLINIEWSMGRTGTLTPIACFNPVEIDGTIVERASLHNYSVMLDTLGEYPYAGEPLKIFKANMIIPQVKPVEEEYRYDYGYIVSNAGYTVGLNIDFCPVCGGATSLEKSDSGVINLVCKNPYCEGKILNKLDHFCGKKGLDIKGLSLQTLEKLYDWNWIKSKKDIFNLDFFANEWSKKVGFGKKSVNNILNAIEFARKCEFSKFISSLGIELIGETVAKEIAKRVEDYSTLKGMVESKFDFESWDGFGPEISKALLEYDFNEADEIVKYLTISNSLFNSEASNKIEGTFVITGSLNSFKNRDELKKIIEDNGGKVSGSISKNTSYLICNDKDSTTGKSASAKKLGVPIITEEEFKEKFLTF